MLAIGFAALLGFLTGRFFKIGALAPAAFVVLLFSGMTSAATGGAGLAAIVAAIAATVCLEFGYLFGAVTAAGRPAVERAAGSIGTFFGR